MEKRKIPPERGTGTETRTQNAWSKVREMNFDSPVLLGPINGESLLKDPKHLAFTLARYKFAAKMLQPCRHILEIGCGEGIGTLTFLAETEARVTAIDFDPQQIAYAREHLLPWAGDRVRYLCQDMIRMPYRREKADGLACLDVIEHLHPAEEEEFLAHSLACLASEGVAVFGTPNQLASGYASPRSRMGHINLFDPDRLVETLGRYFQHVFLFSMNDEVIHTGFPKMAHYLVALCVMKRSLRASSSPSDRGNTVKRKGA